jgi:hypothetical protein
LVPVPGRKRKVRKMDEGKEADKMEENGLNQKKEEAKRRKEWMKGWSDKRDTVDESMKPFVAKHAKEYIRYIEATYV